MNEAVTWDAVQFKEATRLAWDRAAQDGATRRRKCTPGSRRRRARCSTRRGSAVARRCWTRPPARRPPARHCRAGGPWRDPDPANARPARRGREAGRLVGDRAEARRLRDGQRMARTERTAVDGRSALSRQRADRRMQRTLQRGAFCRHTVRRCAIECSCQRVSWLPVSCRQRRSTRAARTSRAVPARRSGSHLATHPVRSQ
jgi:hypothetical protein